MDKPGTEARTVFVSPYLRRPIRPLNKVLSEREEEAADLGAVQPANDVGLSEKAVEHRRWFDNVRRALFSR